MKKLKLLLMFTITGVLLSCGSTKDTSTTGTTSKSVQTSSERGRSNMDNTTSSTNRATATPSERKSTTSEASAAADAWDREGKRLDLMYRDLNMDKDQIAKFQSGWKNVYGDWQRKNKDREMNSYERIEHQDSILKNILSEDQFEEYQNWVRKHANDK